MQKTATVHMNTTNAQAGTWVESLTVHKQDSWLLKCKISFYYRIQASSDEGKMSNHLTSLFVIHKLAVSIGYGCSQFSTFTTILKISRWTNRLTRANLMPPS